MDAVTAVSGSGPAYVFLLAEAMARAGVAAGLPADLAERLARETVAGSGELLHRSPLAAATLRQNVTSPGGTTAAALDVLMAQRRPRPADEKGGRRRDQARQGTGGMSACRRLGMAVAGLNSCESIERQEACHGPQSNPFQSPPLNAARRAGRRPAAPTRRASSRPSWRCSPSKPIEQIGLASIAARAGVSLAELRGEFGSTLAILAAHVKELDRKVLAGDDARHGRGAAARAAVRRADAPHRGDGAATARRRAR